MWAQQVGDQFIGNFVRVGEKHFEYMSFFLLQKKKNTLLAVDVKRKQYRVSRLCIYFDFNC